MLLVAIFEFKINLKRACGQSSAPTVTIELRGPTDSQLDLGGKGRVKGERRIGMERKGME